MSTLGTLIKEQLLLLIGIAAAALGLLKQKKKKNKTKQKREIIASIDLKANDEQNNRGSFVFSLSLSLCILSFLWNST
jgi:hypothetical protein